MPTRKHYPAPACPKCGKQGLPVLTLRTLSTQLRKRSFAIASALSVAEGGGLGRVERPASIQP